MIIISEENQFISREILIDLLLLQSLESTPVNDVKQTCHVYNCDYYILSSCYSSG